MRLLQAMAGGRHGGAEAFFVRLAGALQQRDDIEQKVLIKRGAVWDSFLRDSGIEPVGLAFGGLFDLTTRSRFRKEIKAFQPDIVLTWMNRATRFCPAKSPALRFVHAARLGGYYNLKNYRNCDHLIGNTQDIVDYLVREGWPAERAHYLPNFVDDAKAPAEARAAHDTPEDAPLLLALGRLHANKAFDVLIAALADVPAAVLWIAGSGPEEAALKTLARREGVDGRVRFLGWRDDPAALFAAADLLVCPSRHEPLGNVVIEAWAQGVPVVACAAAGPAALIEDGVSGLLTSVDDAGALAGALNRALESPELCAVIGVGGRAAYEADFTDSAVVAQYMDFFRQIAEQD